MRRAANRRASFAIAGLGAAFQELAVGATLWDGRAWRQIHVVQSPHVFEVEHARDVERRPYNERCLAQATRRKVSVVGHHAGFTDLFVPVVDGARVIGVLVLGPVLTAPPNAVDMLTNWRWLTGRQGHPSDAEFAYYQSMTLETLVLEGERFGQFQRMAEAMAALLALDGEGAWHGDSGSTRRPKRKVTALRARIDALLEQLRGARVPDRIAEMAHSMIDERTSELWLGPYYADDRRHFGLARVPDQALVALFGHPKRPDAVEDAMARAAFQRRCAELTQALGGAIVGRLGDRGVFFLCGFRGTAHARRRRMDRLIDRIGSAARRDGLGVHFGVSATSPGVPLTIAHRQALGAAESALAQDRRAVTADPREPVPSSPLARLRYELLDRIVADPRAFLARFDRFLDAVVVHAGYRIELARAHMDAAFDGAATSLLQSGALDQRSFAALGTALDRAASAARTAGQLSDAYRAAAGELTRAVTDPGAARRERSVQRGMDFLDAHYAEPIHLARVAAAAGFAPKYFSELFKRREGVTFEGYLARLRMEHAKRLLQGTPLDLAQIARLSGFSSAQYFCHAFRRSEKRTPTEFRRGFGSPRGNVRAARRSAS